MTKETLQRVYLFLLFCFGLLVAGVALYRVKTVTQTTNNTAMITSLKLVKTVQAEIITQEAGKSGTIGL